MKLNLRLGLATAALFCSLPALGQGERSLSIRTYGTVGFSKLIKTTERKATDGDTRNYHYTEVTGIPKSGTFMRDTRFGLNVQAPLTEKVTAVAQLNAEAADQIFGSRKNLDVKSSLLFLRVELIDRLKLMLGQTYIPVWAISEEISIGFTYPWVRPPEEVYALSSPQGMVGLNLIYEIPVGEEGVFKPRFLYGDMIFRNQISADVEADAPLRSWGLSGEFEHPNITARILVGQGTGVAYIKSIKRTEVSDSKLPDLKLPAQGTIEGISHPKVPFGSLAVKLNYSDLFLMGEYARRETSYRGTTGIRMFYEDGVDKSQSYQVSTGYTIGKFTPLFGYAFHKNTFEFGTKGKDNFNALVKKAAATKIATDGDLVYASAVEKNRDAILQAAVSTPASADKIWNTAIGTTAGASKIYQSVIADATTASTIYATARAAKTDAVIWQMITADATTKAKLEQAASAEIAKGTFAAAGIPAAAANSPTAIANVMANATYQKNVLDSSAEIKAGVLNSSTVQTLVLADEKTKSGVLATALSNPTGELATGILASADTKAAVLASATTIAGVEEAVGKGIKETSLYPMDQEQSSVIVGCNYAFSDSIAFKLQYQITKVPNKDNLSRGISTLPRGSTSHLVNSAVEFVF